MTPANGSSQSDPPAPEAPSTWRFPKVFWVANCIELFERAAYYGCFIFLSVYLTKDVGFNDVESGDIIAWFACLLYFMPTFMGNISDKVGFRSALALAFALLTAGYALLGAIPEKWSVILALTMIMFGGAIVKPVISGTAAKCSSEANRSRAFSLFYMAVNIGSFTGKSLVDPIRIKLDAMDIGLTGLQAINFYSASMALVALILVGVAYRNIDSSGEGKTVRELLSGLGKVVRNVRFLSLIMIIGGFWAIQGQLYATMPKYLMRMVSDFAKPGWIANVNPLMVVLCVVPINYLVRRIRPISSIGIGLFIIPFTALVVALAPNLGTERMLVLGISLHPLELMLIIGIGLQGIAECFLSPRFLEYASKQAPPGEVGLYMGYSHLTTAFSWLFGFAASGRLLDKWCPAPEVVAAMPEAQRLTAYDHAHYIWFFWMGVGVLAFLLLLLFRYVTDRRDRERDLVGGD
ncbi:MAG: MFS transporter [bacterium]